jgi:hypothetical protein
MASAKTREIDKLWKSLSMVEVLSCDVLDMANELVSYCGCCIVTERHGANGKT